MAQSGTITLMGSGELTAFMVEVHKMLIADLPDHAKITFLDTPAGFQQNADLISAGAVDYFKNRVLKPMRVASYKSHESISEVNAAKAIGVSGIIFTDVVSLHEELASLILNF